MYVKILSQNPRIYLRQFCEKTIFIASVGTLAVIVSFFVSLVSLEWHWFQRSGAVLVVVVIILDKRMPRLHKGLAAAGSLIWAYMDVF